MSDRPELSLTLLHVFAVVAEELHFGRAAQRLNIAQPPLSQQIQRLERIVGHRLFERDTRKVRLTEAGDVLKRVADRLLQEAAAGLEKVRRAGRGQAGLMTIGFTPTTALEVLPAIVQAHRAAYPDVELELIELLPDPMADMLQAERIDVGLGREMMLDASSRTLSLLEERYVAVMPAAHRHAKKKGAIDLALLRDDPFVLYPQDRSSQNNARVMEMCVAAGFIPRAVQEAPGWQTAVSLVGSGLGVTILPACVRTLVLPGVAYRLIDSATVSTVRLMYRAGEQRRVVSHFLATAEKLFARRMPRG